MITQQEACDLVLARFADEPGAISECRLDPRGQYWVIHANSYEYVVNGRWDHCLVGVGAYVVNIATGRLTVTPSHETWEQSIRELYDLDDAAGGHYVLRPSYEPGDKRAIVHLHQRLSCSLVEARWLLNEPNRDWLTGTGRALRYARDSLAQHGVETQVVVQDDPQQALLLPSPFHSLEDLLKLLRERALVRTGPEQPQSDAP